LARGGIRLRFSGFIIFAARVASIATGLAFQLMVARSVTVEEYGILFNINDVIAYFTVLAGVFPFWALRFTARAKSGSVKTGFVVNLAIAVVSSLIYLAAASSITSALDIGREYVSLYFLASAQIIEVYMLNIFESCLQAKMPHTLGYGLMLSEVCKIVLGFVLIICFRMSLFGALVSIIVGVCVQLTYYSRLLLVNLREKVVWAYVREWLKGSTANIYYIIGQQIGAFTFIMLFIYGGEAARSAYGASAQIAAIVSYSSYLASALYPKLLAEHNSKDVTSILKMVLMFAIPMAAGVLAMPDSYLAVLKIEFVEAWPVLMVLAIDSFTATLSTIFSSVIYGLENLDEKASISFKGLVKSRLFVVFTLPYIQSAIVLPTAYYILTTYTCGQPIPSALYIAVVNSITRFIIFLILYKVAREMTEICIPWRNIVKYVFASTVMASILYMIPHPTRLSLTLGVTALGATIYFTILMAIDREAKSLLWSGINEIKRNLHISCSPMKAS